MQAMTVQEAREFIAHNKMGVLALADGGRAYNLPLFYGYDGHALYFQTRPGLKSQFLPRTAEACLAIVRCVTLDDWASVLVTGHVERVDRTPAQLAAMHALMSVPLPPEWGESASGEPLRSDDRLATYKLTPVRISGRYSAPPVASAESIA